MRSRKVKYNTVSRGRSNHTLEATIGKNDNDRITSTIVITRRVTWTWHRNIRRPWKELGLGPSKAASLTSSNYLIIDSNTINKLSREVSGRLHRRRKITLWREPQLRSFSIKLALTRLLMRRSRSPRSFPQRSTTLTTTAEITETTLGTLAKFCTLILTLRRVATFPQLASAWQIKCFQSPK